MFLPSKDVPPTPRQRNARPGTATPVTARRYPLLLTALVVGVALAVIPVLLAFQLAREQAVKEKFRQLDAFASGFALQVRDARQMLDLLVDEGRHSTAPACDADDIRRLQRFDLDARAVQSTLRIDKGRIVCSAAGDLMKHVRLGPAAMIRGDGTRVHINVQIPGIPKLRYTVLERDGYGLLVFPDALMAPFIQDDITLATFSVATGQVSSSSGPVQTGWTRGMDANKTVERFVDRKAQFMVVRTRVTHDGTGVLVATPLSTVNSRIDQFSRWFIPLGALLGLGVLALAFRITRRQFSPRAELLQALRRQQFFLLYQPVFDLQNNTCIGAEALLRWRQPDGSIRAPDLFIPFAEDNGLVPLLTERVLELVQQDMAAFLRQHRRFRLAINLSPHDLQSAQTLQLLARLIADTGPGCGQFMVEITERGLLQESRAVDAINAIRDLGVKVAIDDFGTGYSSLSYLTTYRFDVLKIDKAFTGTACTDAVTNHVALHIIELGRSLGLETLAEGIETGEQAELFRAKGVACAQGYHFARPMPAAELLAFYRQHAGDGDDGGSNGD